MDNGFDTPPPFCVDSLKHGKAKGEECRFARLLAETWRRIPAPTRDALMSFWYSSQPQRAPVITLSDSDTVGSGTKYYGYCSQDGQHLRFNASAVASLADDLVAALVAHECAHAFSASIGIVLGRTQEDTTDVTAASWGFPMMELRREIGFQAPTYLAIKVDYMWWEKLEKAARENRASPELFVKMFVSYCIGDPVYERFRAPFGKASVPEEGSQTELDGGGVELGSTTSTRH
jgi:hypothetical protein